MPKSRCIALDGGDGGAPERVPRQPACAAPTTPLAAIGDQHRHAVGDPNGERRIAVVGDHDVGLRSRPRRRRRSRRAIGNIRHRAPGVSATAAPARRRSARRPPPTRRRSSRRCRRRGREEMVAPRSSSGRQRSTGPHGACVHSKPSLGWGCNHEHHRPRPRRHRHPAHRAARSSATATGSCAASSPTARSPIARGGATRCRTSPGASRRRKRR